MQKIYLYNLYIQFKNALGFNNIDTNSKEFQQEFLEWIKEQKKIGEFYKNYLMLLGINLEDRNSAEIGKGKYDSIAFPQTSGKIISEHASTFGDNLDSSKIINSRININSLGEPYTFSCDKTKRNFTTLKLNSNLIYTQNVYHAEDLYIYPLLNNFGNQMIIGTFGKISDKDRIKKIQELKKVKNDLINDTYDEKYIFSGDNYAFFIKSKEDVAEKIKKNSFK